MKPKNAPPATVRAPGFGRRQLLAGVPGLALLPLVSVGRLAAEGPRPAAPAQDLPDWVRKAREEVPAATASPYFQTGGIGPSPTPVIEQLAERLTFQNRSPAATEVAEVMGRIEPDLRAQLARVFGAGEDEVALTHSTSEGISIVAWSLDWRSGDEVVISNTEHPANVIPWYVLRDRFGIVVREIDLSPGTDLIGEVEKQLSPRTRLISLSHVSRNNGRTLRTEDSARLAELLRARGVRYHLDGAQGPGCVATDFAALGCDCYSTCGHKWLLGPKGTGALFVRRALLDDVQLSWAGAHSHETMDYEGNYTLLPSAARYEFGTRALADFFGFGQAVQWMEDIGFERILDRINDLVDHGIEAIRKTPELGVASPEDPADRSGILVVRLPEGCDPTVLYRDLGREDGILASPVRGERDFRLSIHFFNTREEISSALEAIVSRCA
ncbi:MAG: aminotransferase class V-fold PLP-dependent enzyme [Acidobacteria bacterium]|nr:aminotransferase class V-fold PLP-dependent enzyme [Acidobacteriota bacterium]MXX85932.1 aminotransferase class V-fold PLP-dependent enzyme [Acidobacteriota bacterium]MYG75017.1 aminotransferase class V-fold PLP-dependent enzyme [Acidobacteriota bacterium]